MQSINLATNKYLVKLEKGEELVPSLIEFFVNNQMTFADFNGIGAIKNPELSFYDLATKQYHSQIFNDDYEICSLIGNLCYYNNEVICHAHTTLSTSGFSTIGGHLKSAKVTATLEIFLNCYTLKSRNKVK